MVLAPSAAAGGFYEAKVLEPAASFVARKPVRVWCASTDAAWVKYAAEYLPTHGLTYPGSSVIRLDWTICTIMREQLRYANQPDASLAPSVETLTHEAIHARGEADEGVTDCAAVHEMARVAVVYFGVKPGWRLRSLMAAAWAWRRGSGVSPIFLTVC